MINSFGAAQSGLRASQEQLEAIMNNIANANNENYSKRVSSLSEIRPLGDLVGRGVRLESVNRMIDLSLKGHLQSSISSNGYASQKSEILSSIENIFGELDTRGLSDALDEFYSALEDYKDNPAVNKSLFVSKINNLVSKFNSMHRDISEVREKIHTKAISVVKQVNSIFDQIAQINADLNSSESLATTNFLLDKRDGLEKELSQYIDIDISNQLPSKANIYTISNNGNTLLNGESKSGVFSLKDESFLQQDRYISQTGGESSLKNMKSLTYIHNGSTQVSIAIGDTYDGDVVDSGNMLELFAKKINANKQISSQVTAYVGEHIEDKNGVKTTNILSDYLTIESNFPNSFRGVVQAVNYGDTKQIIEKNATLSQVAGKSSSVQFIDGDIQLTNSALGVLSENLNLKASNNQIQEYKNKLDDIAYTFINNTNGYSLKDGVYKYGTANSLNESNYKYIGLFEGSNAHSIAFRSESLDALEGDDLEYLSRTREYETNGLNIEDALSSIKKQISSQTQEAKNQKNNTSQTQEALKSDYAKIVSVNKDDEMINLIKVQAAYQANAKAIQSINDMLQVLLSIKQ